MYFMDHPIFGHENVRPTEILWLDGGCKLDSSLPLLYHYIVKEDDENYYKYFMYGGIIPKDYKPEKFKKLVTYEDCGKDMMLISKMGSIEKYERIDKERKHLLNIVQD